MDKKKEDKGGAIVENKLNVPLEIIHDEKHVYIILPHKNRRLKITLEYIDGNN